MKNQIPSMLAYNCWANERVAGFIKDELADIEVKSSFTSLRKTLFHIWDAQVIWQQRLLGTSVGNWPSKTFTGSFEEAKKLFIEQSEDFRNIVSGKEDAFFEQSIEYKSIKGEPFSSRMDEILLHVCNHSTFHRGQIITMLRLLGETGLKTTDLISFYRESAAPNN